MKDMINIKQLFLNYIKHERYDKYKTIVLKFNCLVINQIRDWNSDYIEPNSRSSNWQNNKILMKNIIL